MKKQSIRAAIFITCLFQNILGFSQATTLNLPDLLPPSPDVSAITKGAELSSVMHTGAASASIPIYELKLKGFTLPISLNYNSNGYKPEEVPSRVGLGWNLEAGGVVSRIVQGKPDDDTHYPTPPTPIGINDDTWYWVEAISDPESEYDTRPDEYRFSVNGISGKFVYQRDGSILQIPYSNVKINAPLQNGIHIPDIITITDSKGIQYVFGANGEKEETLSHSMTTGYLNKQHIKTAWMLSKILLPNGGRIDFEYAPVDVHKNNGYASGIKKHINPDNTYCSQAFMIFWYCPVSTETVPESHSSIHYNSYYLTSIKVEGIEEIHFEYEDRHDNNPNNNPDDNTGDTRLKEISVFNNQSSRTVKRVQLDYENWVTNSHGNFLYSLSHVKFLDPTNPNIDPQVYTLEYNEGIAPQPGIVNYTKGIDFLGFANASGIPSDKHYLQDLSTDPDFKDNVNAMQPNGNIAQNNMLKKLTYPTGGSETFYCEPNVASYWDNISPETFLKVSVEGIGNTPAAVYTHDFSTNVTQDAEIYASVTWTGPGLPPSQPGGEPEPKTAFVYVINTNDNSAQERTLFGYSTPLTGTPKVHLIAGVPYRLEIHVRDDYQNFGKAAVVYKNNIPSVWTEVKKELCGVRVHKIVSHDPVTGKDIPKYYTYRSLMDTTGQSSASAQKLYQPQYISIEDEASSCASHYVGQDPPNEGGLIVCKAKVFSTNSIATVEINQAAGVVYTHILESDDSLFAHGCIEHKFDFYGRELGLPVLNGDIPDKPLDMNDFMNGKELQTVYYNNERKALKRITNSYSADSRVNGGVEYNYIVRKRYNNSLEHHPVAEEDMECFDVNEYDIYTGWYHLDQTQTEEFDLLNNTVHSNTVTYTYDHTENIAPTSTSTTNSEGVALRTDLKYPNDFSTEEPYNKMVEKNIIEPVIQQDNYKDSKHLYQTFTQWKDWNDQNILNANHYVLGPEILKKQKGDVQIEDRIHYYQYDKYANTLEVSKENDIRISYIWGYRNSRPVAEITNASFGNGIAYTTFEADDLGGWTNEGDPEPNAGAVTGTWVGNLLSGKVRYEGPLEQGKYYIVTYWAKNGTVWVNGSVGQEMVSKNGWTLFKHEILNNTTDPLKIDGTALIDELRLYPKGAFMKTFTYSPGVGLSETSDVNSIYQKYEYDGFNRLIRIRDWDKNIIKQWEYKYGESIPPCANPNADWQPTGRLRCDYHYLVTGVLIIKEEREELDHNNCSLTYNTKKWVYTASPGGCPSAACIEPSHSWIIDDANGHGHCEEGIPTSVISEYIGNMTWMCSFHYVFSDGSISTEVNTFSDSPCTEVPVQ